MAKKKNEVTELERIRGHAWVSHCMKISGCNQTGLARLIHAVNDKNLWSKYKNGNTPPPSTTVKVVDQVLPSTGEVWFCGPFGLPLWAVLGANQEEQGLKVCSEVLEAELANQVSRDAWWLLSKKPIGSMSLEEKAQALLEASLPMHYWHRKNYVDDFPEDIEGKTSTSYSFVDRNELFLTLDEFLEKPNALSLAYKEGKKRKFRIGSGGFGILKRERLVAFVALIVLCGNTSQLSKLHSFLKAGIHEALADGFGKAIADYVSSPRHI